METWIGTLEGTRIRLRDDPPDGTMIFVHSEESHPIRSFTNFTPPVQRRNQNGGLVGREYFPTYFHWDHLGMGC